METTTFFTSDFGIFPDSSQNISQKLQKAFETLPDNCVFIFKKGKYYLKERILIENKHNVCILGNSSTLTTHFDPCGPISGNNNIFEFHNCSDVELTGFYCDTDAPTSAAGTVTAIDRENGTADLQIYDEFPVTGFEHFCGTNSFDEFGSPDYALATYHNEPIEQEFTTLEGNISKRLVGQHYDLVGKQTVRLRLNSALKDSLVVGHKVNIRYEIYGNCALTFKSCHRFVLKDITVYSAPSFAACIHPRSSDFTFDNFNIRVPDDSNRLMATNADGIHVLGLYGKLTLKNCNMEHMGDDTLNIHGQAGGIKSIDTDSSTMVLNRPFRGKDLALKPLWAVEGDEIIVYDSNTFLEKGKFTISKIEPNGRVKYNNLVGFAECGDTVANATYYSSLHIDGCVVRNTRARGFLVQTHNVLIENSYIYGMSLPAMLFAPDIKMWWEVGPTKNVEIRNNIIEYSANIKSNANKGAIVFKACHDNGGADYPAGVHENIFIHHNKFINLPHSAIYVSAAKNVRIENNHFNNCCCDVKDDTQPYAYHDVVAINCDNISLTDNISSRGEKNIVYINNYSENH